ncbi:MAG: DUF454 family protein [Candidatus Thermoplasmatota archaeon]|nr:DUF454 family protein [Candidatus Thermoplasmatota archaeon]MEC8362879.1 DUF454 family protein [Candidatus Thermoplasmatota archaeon]MEC8722418.1 DUF454 family protein [Candidatus Thermoplasmatota archaeon]
MEPLRSVDEIVDRYSVENSSFKSKLYIGLGSMFVVFAIAGIWIPGWPTVSWAVPAAFLFSLSSPRLFRWSLTNRFFGAALFQYYATGKTIPGHAKTAIALIIITMTLLSSYGVWAVSTRGDGSLFDPRTWNGADPGYGASTILIVGIIGVWYVLTRVRTRNG